jgi:hypothetical protein
MKKILTVLLLSSCMNADQCKEMCAPNLVLYFTKDNCECLVPEATQTTTPTFYERDKFCRSCSDSCGVVGMKTCKFGNDTWGNGPDICECGRPLDAGI